MKRPGPCDADVPVVVLRSLHRHMSRTVYRLVPYNRCRQWLHHWNRANERGNPLWLGPTLTRAGWTPETAAAMMPPLRWAGHRPWISAFLSHGVTP